MNKKLNSNSIRLATKKAFLIKEPKTEFVFWFPRKMAKIEGKNHHILNLWAPRGDWTLKMSRKGKNGNVLEEKEVNFEDLAEGV